MKNRYHGPPLSSVSMDNWEDGSWTVDCSCGVTFDDGEEMVDCDECGVWVHTRCSGFIKGEASFTCGKCEAKMPGSSSADQNVSRNIGNNNISLTSNNEETEVAQLLVELPTKADTFPPPVSQQRPAFRLWTQIPMEERVHVNGVPGGDPALFHGISSFISSSLWNCAGYVPKKFNFKYKDFSSFNSDENDNPANAGANLLFSLSKETAPFGAAEILAQMPSLRGSARRDDKVLCNNDGKNSGKKDRNKHLSFSISPGKREGLSVMNKDVSGKNKSMTYGCKITVNNKKRGLAPTTDISDQGMTFHGLKPDFLGSGSVNNKEEISSEPPLITGKERSDSRNNLENTDINSDAVDSKQLTKGSNDMGNLIKGSSTAEEKNKLKHVSGELINNNTSNLLILPTHPDASSEFVQDPKKVAAAEELTSGDVKAARNLDIQDPCIDVQKLDFKNSSSIFSQRQVDQSYEDLQIHESMTVPESDMQNPHDGYMGPESMHHDCKKSPEGKCSLHIDTKNQMREEESTSGTTEMFAEKYFKSSDKISNSADGGHKIIEPVQTSTASFQADNLKLPNTGRHKSPDTSPSTSTGIVSFTKRLKLDDGSVGKTDNGEHMISELDLIPGEMSRKMVKTHTRSPGSLSDRTSLKNVSQAPTSNLRVINSKENLLCQSSKASSEGNSPATSGLGKSPGYFKNQSDSMPLKFRPSSSSQRHERMNSSSSQVSGKFSNHLQAMCPSSTANISANLSDEELAKRLHQELNSSPRVSRIPRGFPKFGMKSCSSAGGSMLSKHSSSSGGKHQAMVSRRKNKDETHGTGDGKDRTDLLQTSGLGKPVSVAVDGSSKDGHKRLSDAVPSSERSAEFASTTGLS